MAARPRKHNISIPGLYRKLDKRNGKVYWQYKHPKTGRFYSLGTNEEQAMQAALELNTILADQMLRQTLAVTTLITKANSKSDTITVTQWLDKYRVIQDERVEAGEIVKHSAAQKKKPIDLLNQSCGMKPLSEVSVLDVVEIIDSIKEKGHARMAQYVRSVLIDIFKEAQHAGYVPPGHNPAAATKKPRAKTTRERLSFDEWRKIYEQAAEYRPQLRNAMLLALVTGQRCGDIVKMKFSDIWDDMLHIEQGKTGAKIALPLNLRNEAISMSLREVISQCRDSVVSNFIVHYRHSTPRAKAGAPVTVNNISDSFSQARDDTGLTWAARPPSFHEQRSLSERLYRQQGLDTQRLLGHKNSSMTDLYNDDRGKEWHVLAV